jgi:hypothetical protein
MHGNFDTYTHTFGRTVKPYVLGRETKGIQLGFVFGMLIAACRCLEYTYSMSNFAVVASWTAFVACAH